MRGVINRFLHLFVQYFIIWSNLIVRACVLKNYNFGEKFMENVGREFMEPEGCNVPSSCEIVFLM